MSYLMDTHVLLWFLMSTEKLSDRALEVLTDAHTDVYVSTVSFWELSLKHALGKLSIEGFELDDLEEIVCEAGVGIIGLNERESSSFHRLPLHAAHRDPFDRMLIWQAIKRDMGLLSNDQHFALYRSYGLRLVW
ncbi:MAG: type II toxin-antitoxin system VapC family toxin [Coriobacteriales bacterium]|jgi:PIN domain nuclease of toxin-antitoxin system|nr:type II toxin-antitoxin system VapC family toxin [Coriobacteriales bacterium]